jgi:hypothetical protein
MIELSVQVKLNRSRTGRCRPIAHFPATESGRRRAVGMCKRFNKRHPRTYRGPHRAAAFWVCQDVPDGTS